MYKRQDDGTAEISVFVENNGAGRNFNNTTVFVFLFICVPMLLKSPSWGMDKMSGNEHTQSGPWANSPENCDNIHKKVPKKDVQMIFPTGKKKSRIYNIYFIVFLVLSILYYRYCC